MHVNSSQEAGKNSHASSLTVCSPGSGSVPSVQVGGFPLGTSMWLPHYLQGLLHPEFLWSNAVKILPSYLEQPPHVNRRIMHLQTKKTHSHRQLDRKHS